MVIRLIPALGLLLATLAAPVNADDPKFEDVDPKGKPTTYKVGASARFAVWYDASGWHLRETTASKEQTAFTGTIETVGGKITTMSLIGSGSKPSPALKANTEKFNLKDRINKGLEGGMDLKLEDSVTAIKFDLQIDGKAVPEMIFIGAKGQHPTEGTFALPAKPGKK